MIHSLIQRLALADLHKSSVMRRERDVIGACHPRPTPPLHSSQPLLLLKHYLSDLTESRLNLRAGLTGISNYFFFHPDRRPIRSAPATLKAGDQGGCSRLHFQGHRQIF